MIVLATLCLNEMEWLPRLWEQHCDWPGAKRWVFVEASDPLYPSGVAIDGLSTDGTTEWLADLEESAGGLVVHAPRGQMPSADDPAQAKCWARTQYLHAADEVEPDWIIVIDADEFYSRADQAKMTEMLGGIDAMFPVVGQRRPAVLLGQRHVWRPPSVGGPLLAREVTGGYWDVPHIRVWPWEPGLRYAANHNWPERRRDGSLLNADLARWNGGGLPGRPNPQCVHLGFASSLARRAPTHAYYQARGEGEGDGRQMYVDCRAAWETWQEGDALPHGARVIPYDGPRPEALEEAGDA